MAVKPKYDLWLVIPDLHVDYHDPAYWSVALQVAERERLTGVVQLGDFLDCPQISAYDKDPRRMQRLAEDIEVYNDMLDQMTAVLPRSFTWHQLEGNHEDRLRRYCLKSAPATLEMVKDWPDLLKFPERRTAGRAWHWHRLAKWNSLKLGRTVLHHGHFFDKHTAANNLTRYPGYNFIQGHTHRAQVVYDGERFSATLGHGADDEQTKHQPTPSAHRQALGLLSIGVSMDYLELVPVDNGMAMVRGEAVVA